MSGEESFFDKTPFYMTYPMQNLYEAELEYEKDMERVKSWNPKQVVQLQELIDKRCDELEYEGSRMYDEEPDYLMMSQEAMGIYEQIKGELEEVVTYKGGEEYLYPPKDVKIYFSEISEAQLEAASCGYGNDNWLCSMVEVLFYNEIYRRRCRHRRCRRWW